MKNIILISLLAISCSTFAQTIRRCNNNPGISGVNVYTTIQAAHDAAAVGDIIYVEPSVTSYGNLTCSKRLTIIGNGYFLTQNPNVSFDIRMSKIDGFTFNLGCANSSITGVYTNNLTFNGISNITLERCFVENVNYVSFSSIPSTFITFSKCVITGSILGYDSAPSRIPRNCTFTNNIFSGGIQYFSNSVFTNNTFATVSNGNLDYLLNCTISNNIFRSNGCNSCTQQALFGTNNTGTTISNNIIAYVQTVNTCSFTLPTGNGNVNGADYSALFIVPDPYSSGLVDKNFQLAAGSPAIGIGTGGTNAGAFGGANPYILSGLPAYPVMTNFTTSGVGNTSTPLQVSVTVRGNN
jgi:hypothetical protein